MRPRKQQSSSPTGGAASRKGRGARSSDDPNAPFPTRQLLVLALCRFSEPIAFCSILAYSFVMVKDLGVPEREASLKSGLLLSAYVGGETLTSMSWGILSDRIGRKPVVLLGLTGVAISSLIVGLAQSYWVALAARFIGGSLNGNVSVMQTMTAEMVKNPAHEPRAYSIQPFIWTFGSMVGTAMGGFAAQPAVFYPHIFSPDGIFGRYPYLLPNGVAVVAVVLAIVCGIFFLEETLVVYDDDDLSIIEEEEDFDAETVVLAEEPADETTPLRPSARRSKGSTFKPPTTATVETRSASSSSSSLRSRSSSRSRSPPPSPWNRTVIPLVLATFICAAHGMASGSLFPIHLLDDPQKPHPGFDFKGGLGYTVHDVGAFLSMNGFIEMFIQTVLFPAYVARLGVWRSFVSVIVCFPLCYLIPPFLSALPGMAVVPGIYSFLTLQSFFGTVLYPVTFIMLKDATPHPAQLGRVNGLTMAAACAARTFSPPLAGSVYGFAGSAMAWFYCFLVACLGTMQVFFVPRHHRHEDDDKAAEVDMEVAASG